MSIINFQLKLYRKKFKLLKKAGYGPKRSPSTFGKHSL